jgi:hypothetical protein
MFAINHAATALLLKRRYPSVSMVPLVGVFASAPGHHRLVARRA